jgi:intron-binding protein aquarius
LIEEDGDEDMLGAGEEGDEDPLHEHVYTWTWEE